MQEPDNFHFHCFEKNAVKVFIHASVNKVLTKYCNSINRVFGSTCTKVCINLAIYQFIWFLHETRSTFYDALHSSGN